MSIQDALLSSIETMIKNTAADYIPQSDFACVVKAIVKGKYQVSINGADYLVTNGVGIVANPGSAVWVHVPNQNFGKAFIIGAQNNATSSGGGGGGTSTVMTGATATSDGTSGAVPKPIAGQQNKFLRGDASWVDVNAVTELYTNTMPSSGNNGDIVLLKY